MERLAKIGRQITDNTTAKLPGKVVLQGRLVRLEPLVAEIHHRSLFKNFLQTPNLFEHMIQPDLTTVEEFRQRCLDKQNDKSRVYFVVSKLDLPREYVALGFISCVEQDNRKVEFGRGMSSYIIRNTTASTEVLYLILRHVFEDLKYIKVVIRTFPGNEKSARMIQRLGFSYDGKLRSDYIAHGYAIDLLLYTMLVIDWPVVKQAIEGWLNPVNFDNKGTQKESLQVVRKRD